MSSADYAEQVIRKAACYRPNHLRQQAVLALHAFAFQHECMLTELWSCLEDIRQCPSIADEEETADMTMQMMQVFADFQALEKLVHGILDIDADFPRVGGEAFQATADEMRHRQAQTASATQLESARRSLEQLITKSSDSNENA